MNDSESTPVIIHESELQRQHARIALPGSARIGTDFYSVKNLSAGGLAVSAVKGFHKSGDILPLHLTLRFDDFSITIDFNTRVQHYDARAGLLGLSFISLNKQKLSILVGIIRKVIAGDYLSGEEILQAANRTDFARLGENDNTKQKPLSLMGKILAATTIALLGLAATGFIAGNIYENLFLLKSQNAFVGSEMQVVKSPAAGLWEITAKDNFIRKGETLGMIGKTHAVVSPCDCVIYKREASGQTAALQQNIATLVPVRARPFIVAELGTNDVQRVKTDLPVTIRISGTRLHVSGKIAGIQYAATPSPHAVITIKPDQSLPVDLTGRPAQITFRVH